MTITAPERPALDPDPISERIDAILAEVTAERLDQLTAYEQITDVLDGYANEIESAGGGEHGDPDMWDWSQRVRFAAIPDGCEPMEHEEYLGEFGDALTCLWEDPRMDEEDDSGE